MGKQVYGPHSSFKMIVQAPSGPPYGLQNAYGSRMGSFDF